MLDGRSETQARLLRDEIDALKAERAEKQGEVQRAEAGLDEAKIGSRLWDRHLWLLFLGGDRAVYERIRPLLRELRQRSRQVRQIESRLAAKVKKFEEVIGKGLRRDPKYSAILAKQKKAKLARDSCTRMLELVTAARQRIDDAMSSRIRHPRDEASRSAIDRDASEVSERVRAVRQHAAGLRKKARAHGSFDGTSVSRLDINFSGWQADLQVRNREFKHAASRLESIDKSVESLLGEITERERALEEERQQYFNRVRDDSLGP